MPFQSQYDEIFKTNSPKMSELRYPIVPQPHDTTSPCDPYAKRIKLSSCRSTLPNVMGQTSDPFCNEYIGMPYGPPPDLRARHAQHVPNYPMAFVSNEFEQPPAFHFAPFDYPQINRCSEFEETMAAYEGLVTMNNHQEEDSEVMQSSSGNHEGHTFEPVVEPEDSRLDTIDEDQAEIPVLPATRPSNRSSGAPWSEEDKRYLLSARETGEDWPIVAANLQRSVKACQLKFSIVSGTRASSPSTSKPRMVTRGKANGNASQHQPEPSNFFDHNPAQLLELERLYKREHNDVVKRLSKRFGCSIKDAEEKIQLFNS